MDLIEIFLLPTLILSFILGIFGLFCVFFIFPKINLLDFPKRYNLNRKRIPYPAGIMVITMFTISTLLFNPFDKEGVNLIYTFLLSLFILSAVSYIDDRKNISIIYRLFFQSISALIIIFSGIWIEFLTNPLSTESIQIPFYIGGTITFIWIIGFINTTNWLDGIPNLTLSSGAVSSFVLGVLSLSPVVNQKELSILCFIFFITLIPFLVGNLGKTRFILGDTGSMGIGFCLAVFSLFAGGKMATLFIVMSIPIFDGIFVVIARMLKKKSPFKGKDGLHLHDVLIKRKWKESYIFLLYFFFSIILGISVLFLTTVEKIILIITWFSLFILFRIYTLPRYKTKFKKEFANNKFSKMY
jgi:UDP-GlcNAc:undecaprenyl-phosphate GlcNAc-1-phosphate transferase